jgi:hypothetical protein
MSKLQLKYMHNLIVTLKLLNTNFGNFSNVGYMYLLHGAAYIINHLSSSLTSHCRPAWAMDAIPNPKSGANELRLGDSKHVLLSNSEVPWTQFPTRKVGPMSCGSVTLNM